MTMINVLDFHNHVFPENISRKIIESVKKEKGFIPYGDGTILGLLKEMKRSGVKESVILAVAVSPAFVTSTNSWIIKQKKNSLIPVGSIHPLYESYKEEVKRLKEEGIKGIKFNSLFQNFRPDDERAFPLYEEILSHGMFMIFHSGPGLISKKDEEVLATPERISRLLSIFPKISMIVAHFGGAQLEEEAKKHILGKDVYIDTSYPPGLCFKPKEWTIDLIKRHDPERILFGTDTPFARQKEEIEYILNLPISDDLKEKILWKNGRRLLGSEG